MAITSQQIALLAGVSRGTVDRVLNNRSGVRRETRERVCEIAKAHGYVPNRAGKALSRAKRPLCVGLVLNCEGIRFYDEVLRGIESGRSAYPDFQVELHWRRLRGYQAREQLAALAALREGGAQCVIITPVSDPAVARGIDETVAAGIPVVTLNSDIEHTRRMLYVGCNYLQSGRTAAGLIGLLAHGEGAVGVVAGSLNMLGHTQRVRGFTEALREAFPRMRVAGVAESGDDDVTSYVQVKALLARAPDITAIYFAAAGAYGGVKALAECRPDRLPIVVASDATPETREMILDGRLQAIICQEPFRQGYEAVRCALETLITGRPAASGAIYMNNEIRIAQNIGG